VIGAGESQWHGGSRSGTLFGDLFDALIEVAEDIGLMKLVRGGAEHIASCHCSQ
jgi:hypothetical protein